MLASPLSDQPRLRTVHRATDHRFAAGLIWTVAQFEKRPAFHRRMVAGPDVTGATGRTPCSSRSSPNVLAVIAEAGTALPHVVREHDVVRWSEYGLPWKNRRSTVATGRAPNRFLSMMCSGPGRNHLAVRSAEHPPSEKRRVRRRSRCCGEGRRLPMRSRLVATPLAS